MGRLEPPPSTEPTAGHRGPIVAVLGGGQLGRMLGLAALPLGVSCRFLDPSPDAPAGAVGPLLGRPFDDTAAVVELCAGAAAVTYEWEGVPAATAREAGLHAPLRPGPEALEAARDRLAEKLLFERLGVATAPFAAVDERRDLDEALALIGLPAVLKTRRGGYDGKGQTVLRASTDVDAAWARRPEGSLIVEGWVPFRRELSIVGVRSATGETAFYPLVENEHAAGILRVTRAPARVGTGRQLEAERILRSVFEALDYAGVGCVELFDPGDGHPLVANELAPRVHNSGHWTIEGAVTSQFENHLRAVLGWPLGAPGARGHAAMVNLIGALPDRDGVLALPGAHWHDYEKAPRPGRKLGHVTLEADDPEALEGRLAALLRLVPSL